MKIYFLSSSAFSDNQMSILKYLSKKHEITYAVIIPYTNSNYSKEELYQFCKANGLQSEFYSLKYRFRDPRVIPSYLSILRSIKNKKPDVVYFTNFDQLYLNAALLMLSRSKTVIAFHDVENHSGTALNNLANLSKSILISRFKYFHVFSHNQEKLLRLKAPNKNIYTISLPLVDFGPPREQLKKSDIVNFLFFGNILHYKGLDILLVGFKEVVKQYPNIQLTIAGRCIDWEEKYAQMTKSIPQIKTDIRFIENHEIPAYFSNAHYLVLPYRDTTQSGPLMISHSYNIPVLVSKAEGFEEFTEDGVTGFSFKIDQKGDVENVLKACVLRSTNEYETLKKNMYFYTNKKISMQTIINKYDLMFNDVESIR